MIMRQVLGWKYRYTTLGPKTIQQSFLEIILMFWKLGPVDNRPSTVKLHHFVQNISHMTHFYWFFLYRKEIFIFFYFKYLI